MNTNMTIEWCGYTMNPHPEHKDGILVLDPEGQNSMPGAAWFTSVAEAKKGIAAHRLALQTGGDFWMFMELAKS